MSKPYLKSALISGKITDITYKSNKDDFGKEVDITIFISDLIVPVLISEKLTNACGAFIEVFNYELETKDEPIFGSFFNKLSFLKKHSTEQKIDNAIEKGAKALELKHVELPTAEQTQKLAAAAKDIVDTLKEIDEGVVKIGALLTIKKVVNGKTKLLTLELPFHIRKLFEEKPQLLLNLNTTWQIVTGEVVEFKEINDSVQDSKVK